MKCHLWGKCETEPDVHYEGGELRVFDHVEVTGISLFEMDRMSSSDSEYTLGSDSREFSGKDSDYEQNSDDNDYEENVDHNLEWLGVENHRKEQLKRNEKKECVKETVGQTMSNSDTDDDNSDIDVAPDSGSDIDSLQGSDEEGHCRPLMYDPKHADNPNLEIR